jgi:hypothetical protein
MNSVRRPERKLTVGEQSAPDLQTSGAGDLTVVELSEANE